MNLDDMPLQGGAALPRAREARLEFTGSGAEYFRIWIVNLLLSILTLGVYSAWAKVRRERFFLRNTLLERASFDYHGDPMAILKGRILVVVALVAINFAEKINPLMNLVASIVFLLLLPWMISRALRFRAANSSWRGLRFRFTGTPAGAAGAYVLWPFLAIITLGLLFPVSLVKQRAYVINQLRFGGAPFAVNIPLNRVYGVVFKATLLFIVGLVLAIMVGTVALARVLSSLNGDPQIAGAVIGLAVVWSMMLLVAAVLPYIRVRLSNLVWNQATLDSHAFRSDMRVRDYYRIVAVNWLLTVLTLGLYWPFARVRLWRYRATHFVVLVAGDLDGFLAVQQQAAKVLGEEAADILDVDVGL